MSFNSKLTNLLKTNPLLLDEDGELILAAVQDRAWKIDHDFIKLLLSDSEIKGKFFVEIEGHWVFNINTFLEYISQKNFFDNSYTRFRNRLGLTIDGKYLSERGEVALAWAYKDCVLEGGQTKKEEKRKEIFFNEVLAQDEINRLLDPKVLTNFTRYTSSGKKLVSEIKRSENGIIRENLVIKGNNLIALHTLKEQFSGRVKLIYIDPPYNRDAETLYNDNFRHSSWLVFMKNRLEVAYNFLSEDGVIYISIDDTEFSYLKVLCDQIFGRENFITSICVKTSSINGLRTKNNKPTKVKDYILLYCKNISHFVYKQQFEEDWNFSHYNIFIEKRGADPADWIIHGLTKVICEKYQKKDAKELSEHTINQFVLENFENIYSSQPIADRLDRREYSAKNPDRISIYLNPDGSETLMFKKRILDPLSEKFKLVDGKLKPYKLIGDLWTDINYTGIDKEGGVKFLNGKKPEKLLRRIIETITEKSDIFLDFFIGSGTSVAVAHKLGRQYIGIEQIEYEENDSIIRLNNVIKGDRSGISKFVNWQGGGDFIFCELMKNNQSFIDRIQSVQNVKELLTIWDEMAKYSFLNWYVNPKSPKEAINDFISIGNQDNGLNKQKKLLVELLDKNQLYVNLSEMEDAQFQVSEEDKALNKSFYGEC